MSKPINYYWKKEKLGSDEFKQDEKGNISKGNGIQKLAQKIMYLFSEMFFGVPVQQDLNQ